MSCLSAAADAVTPWRDCAAGVEDHDPAASATAHAAANEIIEFFITNLRALTGPYSDFRYSIRSPSRSQSVDVIEFSFHVSAFAVRGVDINRGRTSHRYTSRNLRI